MKDFNNAIRLQPNSVNAYNNRGLTYLLQGNKKQGCGDVQKACALGNCYGLEWAKGKKYCRCVNSRHNRASVFRRNEASTKGSKTILDTSFKTSFSPPFWS
jgi:hypothetical protein